AIGEREMIDARARVHGVARENRIDPRVDDHVGADLAEVVRRPLERRALPAPAAAEPEAVHHFALAAQEEPRAIVVLVEGRVRLPRHRAAEGDPVEDAAIEPLLDVDGRALGAAPRQRKHHAAALAEQARLWRPDTCSTVASSKGMPTRTSAMRRTSSSDVAVLP